MSLGLFALFSYRPISKETVLSVAAYIVCFFNQFVRFYFRAASVQENTVLCLRKILLLLAYCFMIFARMITIYVRNIDLNITL